MQRSRRGHWWGILALVGLFPLTPGCETPLVPMGTGVSSGSGGDVSTFVQDFAREALAAFLF